MYANCDLYLDLLLWKNIKTFTHFPNFSLDLYFEKGQEPFFCKPAGISMKNKSIAHKESY